MKKIIVDRTKLGVGVLLCIFFVAKFVTLAILDETKYLQLLFLAFHAWKCSHRRLNRTYKLGVAVNSNEVSGNKGRAKLIYATYMLKAHLSLSSIRPRDVTESAQRNSRKSIVPSELASKVLWATS